MITEEQAENIADAYLLDYVGDLLYVDGGGLLEEGVYTFPVHLAYMNSGYIGVLGKIRVREDSGEVIFTEEDRKEVEETGKRLVSLRLKEKLKDPTLTEHQRNIIENTLSRA